MTGLERESYGLNEAGARQAMARYSHNPDITDLKLWCRPKPEKWMELDPLEMNGV